MLLIRYSDYSNCVILMFQEDSDAAFSDVDDFVDSGMCPLIAVLVRYDYIFCPLWWQTSAAFGITRLLLCISTSLSTLLTKEKDKILYFIGLLGQMSRSKFNIIDMPVIIFLWQDKSSTQFCELCNHYIGREWLYTRLDI